MGASNYNGKGSTSSTLGESPIRRKSQVRSNSPMVEMLELLEEVEKCRDIVESRQYDLDSAKKDLEKAEQKVSAKVEELDPQTKARYRKMLGGIEEKGEEKDER